MDVRELESRRDLQEEATGKLEASLAFAADKLRDAQQEVLQMEAREKGFLRREAEMEHQLKDFEKQHTNLAATWVNKVSVERDRSIKQATEHAKEVAKLRKLWRRAAGDERPDKYEISSNAKATHALDVMSGLMGGSGEGRRQAL